VAGQSRQPAWAHQKEKRLRAVPEWVRQIRTRLSWVAAWAHRRVEANQTRSRWMGCAPPRRQYPASARLYRVGVCPALPCKSVNRKGILIFSRSGESGRLSPLVSRPREINKYIPRRQWSDENPSPTCPADYPRPRLRRQPMPAEEAERPDRRPTGREFLSTVRNHRSRRLSARLKAFGPDPPDDVLIPFWFPALLTKRELLPFRNDPGNIKGSSCTWSPWGPTTLSPIAS